MTANHEKDERRAFSRVHFDANAELAQGDHIWQVHLLDISLKGVLIERPDNWEFDASLPFYFSLHLDNYSTVINMETKLSHEESNHIGLTCEHIDLDSIIHLRRLVELNIGDETLLERELSLLGNH